MNKLICWITRHRWRTIHEGWGDASSCLSCARCGVNAWRLA